MRTLRRMVPLLVAQLLAANLGTDHATAGEVLDRITERGVLVVATDPVWPPYSWKDESGQWHGFDVEVHRKLRAVWACLASS